MHGIGLLCIEGRAGRWRDTGGNFLYFRFAFTETEEPRSSQSKGKKPVYGGFPFFVPCFFLRLAFVGLGEISVTSIQNTYTHSFIH